MKSHGKPWTLTALALLALFASFNVAGVHSFAEAGDEIKTTPPSTPQFDPATYEADRAAVYEMKDLKLAEELLSQYFNDVGLSKQEELSRLGLLFDEYEAFQAKCYVPDFKIFTGGDRASVREVLEVNARRPGETKFATIIRTRGWASCIFEDNRWKIYGIQHAASDKVKDFDFFSETGEDWEGWTVGGVTDGIFASIDDANAVKEMPLDSYAFVAAKDAASQFNVHADYSTHLFNENGNSWEDFLAQEDERSDIYDLVEHRFRILAFKRFPGTNLGAWKAIYEIVAQEEGTTEMKPVLQVMGYASVIYEDGMWRVYSTQPSRRIWVQNFDFEAEKLRTEPWPGWQFRWDETVAPTP